VKQVIGIGAAVNDGTGDPLRTAYQKINGNFDEVYAALGAITPYTDEQVRDVVAATLAAGSNVTVTPNDGADTITIAAMGDGSYSDEQVRDVIAAALAAGANVTITPNDGADTITIAAAAGASYSDEQSRDALGAALASGAGILIVVDDVAETITIAVRLASAAEFRAGTEDGKLLSPDAVFDAAEPVALAPGASVAVDMATGFNFTLAMGGNYTLASPTNEKPGQSGYIKITQDATGSRTLAYGSEWKFAGGTDPVLSTAVGAIDVLFYQVLSSGVIFANLAKAIA
jgi:hypothetical protein